MTQMSPGAPWPCPAAWRRRAQQMTAGWRPSWGWGGPGCSAACPKHTSTDWYSAQSSQSLHRRPLYNGCSKMYLGAVGQGFSHEWGVPAYASHLGQISTHPVLLHLSPGKMITRSTRASLDSTGFPCYPWLLSTDKYIVKHELFFSFLLVPENLISPFQRTLNAIQNVNIQSFIIWCNTRSWTAAKLINLWLSIKL